MTTKAALNGIPAMGLGTYGRWGVEGVAAMRAALEMGYRHLDTAQSYNTEETVAEAIRQSGVPRKEIFITTKVASVSLARRDFLPSVEKSLESLRVDQIDLTLVHWPSAGDAVPFESYVEDLGVAQDRGWTRLIGVSNFPIALIRKATGILGKGRLANNQVEVHPYLQNRKLRSVCADNGAAVTAYMPIAKGKVASDPVLSAIARRHDATAAQVALAFLLAEGLIVIPSSASKERLAENLAAMKITLTVEDVDAIRRLDCGERIINPATAPAWDD